MIEVTIRDTYSQKRHRTSGRRRYDPSAGDKKTIRKHLMGVKPSEPLEGEFEILIVSFFQTPTSWSDKKQREHEGKYRGKVPDWDNVGKIICDAMNDYILKDDKQIVRAVVEKRYSTVPATYIKLTRI